MGRSSKDKRDIYYRKAKEEHWRARSAFKLIQLDEEFNLFANCTRVVDLCAAPGSWSQVLSRILIQGERLGRRAWEDQMAGLCQELGKEDEKLKSGGGEKWEELGERMFGKGANAERQPKEDGAKEEIRIVAIDLQPITPLEGITMLQADITAPSTVPLLLNALAVPYTKGPSDPKPSDTQSDDTQTARPQLVDLVLSDGAPDVTGLHDLDIYIQSQLLTSALDLATLILRPGTGKFVAKIFRVRDVDILMAQLHFLFRKVTIAKPAASRASSLEAFVVCEGFYGPLSGHERKAEDETQRQSQTAPLEAAAQSLQKTNRLRDLPAEIVTIELPPEPAEDGPHHLYDGVPRPQYLPDFVACGDLSAWDADGTYPLPSDHTSLAPVQPPIAAPYAEAVAMRRKQDD